MIGTSIVKLENKELTVGTWDLSKSMKVEHRMLTRTIEKYMDDFVNNFGFIASSRQRIESSKKGGQAHEYRLDEPQAMYLLTLLTNMGKVRDFKMWLTKEFFKQRKFLMQLSIQRQNTEWIEKRTAGKIERRIETDNIKEFIEYAKTQGSSNSPKYYMIISKMENSCLLSVEILQMEFPNIREVLSGFALDALKMCDYIVSESLSQGMKENLFYKDIFKKAKERVENFASVLGKIGIEKGILPSFRLTQKME